MTEPINTFKNLDEIFNVEPTPVENMLPAVTEEEKQLPAVAGEFPSMTDLESDYQKARDSIRSLLDKSDHIVDNMIQIAIQTESARSFEVASTLIKTMGDLAKDLVALHKQTQDAKAKRRDTEQGAQIVNNTQNNVVFQGSTSDLLRAMKTSGMTHEG